MFRFRRGFEVVQVRINDQVETYFIWKIEYIRLTISQFN